MVCANVSANCLDVRTVWWLKKQCGSLGMCMGPDGLPKPIWRLLGHKALPCRHTVLGL